MRRGIFPSPSACSPVHRFFPSNAVSLEELWFAAERLHGAWNALHLLKVMHAILSNAADLFLVFEWPMRFEKDCLVVKN